MVRKKVTPRRDAGRARGEAVARAVFAATLEELGSSGVEGLSIVATLEDATADVVSMADTGSLRGDLLALLKRVNELLTHPTGRAILRASASVSADSRIKLLAQERLMAQAMLPVQSLVERARARGEWRDEVKGEVVIFALVGAVMHRVTMEPGKVSSAWLNALVDVMLLGVLPR
jgi:hypothetical protein